MSLVIKGQSNPYVILVKPEMNITHLILNERSSEMDYKKEMVDGRLGSDKD